MDKREILYVRRAGQVLARVRKCGTVWSMGKGLIGSPAPGCSGAIFEGILLPVPLYRQACRGWVNSIHMIGMRCPISVFWINGNTVADRVRAEPGFHFYSPKHPCTAVLELPVQALDAIRAGDVLSIEKAPPEGRDGRG